MDYYDKYLKYKKKYLEIKYFLFGGDKVHLLISPQQDNYKIEAHRILGSEIYLKTIL